MTESTNDDHWRVIAASVQGTSHIDHGLPCQDAYRVAQLPTGALVVAVADGAGSASAGGVGAKLAVEQVMVTLAAHFAKYRPASRRAWRDLLWQTFAAAQHAILTYAAQQMQPPRAYATTLVVLVLHDEGAACGLIGDCAAVVRDIAGELHSLCAPQRGEYANATNFLIQPDVLDLLDVQLWPTTVTEAACFSDGLAPLAMNLTQNRPHAPFFDPLFAFVKETTDADLAAARLTAFLASERVNARTDDDKTLLLVQSGRNISTSARTYHLVQE